MLRNYKLLTFDQLTTSSLYDILALRGAVFVLEPASIYLDADGYDQGALHLCFYDGAMLAAYARLLAPGVKFPEACITRLVVAKSHRGSGLGKHLMQCAITESHTHHGHGPIIIEAQHYAQKLYESLGFEVISDVYILDGIPHVKMQLPEMSLMGADCA